jgi:hypothetical protein
MCAVVGWWRTGTCSRAFSSAMLIRRMIYTAWMQSPRVLSGLVAMTSVAGRCPGVATDEFPRRCRWDTGNRQSRSAILGSHYRRPRPPAARRDQERRRETGLTAASHWLQPCEMSLHRRLGSTLSSTTRRSAPSCEIRWGARRPRGQADREHVGPRPHWGGQHGGLADCRGARGVGDRRQRLTSAESSEPGMMRSP